MAEPEPEESLSDAFSSVARRLRQISREAMAPWDITPSQFRAVGTLVRHGPMRLSELSELLRIAPRSVTEVVDALQERGLVRRDPDPHDRRAVLVRLTEHGAGLVTAIRTARDARTGAYFARLPADDRAELARLLRALRD